MKLTKTNYEECMKKDVYLSPRDAGGEMTEDIVSRLRKETAMAFEDEYGILSLIHISEPTRPY